MDSGISELKNQVQKTAGQLREEFKTIRSGKATPSLLEGIEVETYGGQSKLLLKELATISADAPSVLSITPYDPSTQKDIEKAIQKSPLGVTPQPQGTTIRINLPPLSAEQREKIIKLLATKVEDKKSIIRNMRDDLRKKLKHRFELKEITEDARFRSEKDIDSVTHEAMEILQSIKEKKEEELREI